MSGDRIALLCSAVAFVGAQVWFVRQAWRHADEARLFAARALTSASAAQDYANRTETHVTVVTDVAAHVRRNSRAVQRDTESVQAARRGADAAVTAAARHSDEARDAATAAQCAAARVLDAEVTDRG